MSPLRDVAVTTGIGAGPVPPALDTALPDVAPVNFGHREYALKPSKRRSDSDSHSQRRWEGWILPGRALSSRAGVTSAGGRGLLSAPQFRVPVLSACWGYLAKGS